MVQKCDINKQNLVKIVRTENSVDDNSKNQYSGLKNDNFDRKIFFFRPITRICIILSRQLSQVLSKRCHSLEVSRPLQVLFYLQCQTAIFFTKIRYAMKCQLFSDYLPTHKLSKDVVIILLGKFVLLWGMYVKTVKMKKMSELCLGSTNITVLYM